MHQEPQQQRASPAWLAACWEGQQEAAGGWYPTLSELFQALMDTWSPFQQLLQAQASTTHARTHQLQQHARSSHCSLSSSRTPCLQVA